VNTGEPATAANGEDEMAVPIAANFELGDVEDGDVAPSSAAPTSPACAGWRTAIRLGRWASIRPTRRPAVGSSSPDRLAAACSRNPSIASQSPTSRSKASEVSSRAHDSSATGSPVPPPHTVSHEQAKALPFGADAARSA
jgi:hypothetical protein